ncbi:MAG: DUF2474 domain-containing protein [Betaproteobacteria bacterium]
MTPDPAAPPGKKGWKTRLGWLLLIWVLGVGFMAAATWLLKTLMRLAAS